MTEEERRKERTEGKRREGAKWRNIGGKELLRMEKEEEENDISPVCMCSYKCPQCIGPPCSLLPPHLTLEQ